MDNPIFWWILFGLNFILYGICCIMIIKRKNYTSISIRSPTLLLCNILGNFFMNTIIILSNIFNNNTISSFYYLFRFMMILSMILTYERILICCRIERINKEEEEIDKRLLSKKKYLFQEKFYVRLLLVFLLLFIIAMSIIKVINIAGVEMFYTFNFIYYYNNNNNNNTEENKINVDDIYKSQMLGWIIWNFIEQFVMITYIYRTVIKFIKEKIKTELILFFVIWYIYSTICSFIDYYTKSNPDINKDNINLIVIILSLFINYICLFINGYLPIILSYQYKTAISYHFSPKLMNNMYLFLTNEECYDVFSNYLLKTNNGRGLFYLKLYTHIMKYKLSFVLNIDKNQIFNDANQIYNIYFANNNNNLYENQIDQVTLKKVRADCQALENNTYTKELFDEALQFVFNELKIIFSLFRNTMEYKHLYNKIRLESYIQCKMCNTGLIKQY